MKRLLFFRYDQFVKNIHVIVAFSARGSCFFYLLVVFIVETQNVSIKGGGPYFASAQGVKCL